MVEAAGVGLPESPNSRTSWESDAGDWRNHAGKPRSRYRTIQSGCCPASLLWQHTPNLAAPSWPDVVQHRYGRVAAQPTFGARSSGESLFYSGTAGSRIRIRSSAAMKMFDYLRNRFKTKSYLAPTELRAAERRKVRFVAADCDVCGRDAASHVYAHLDDFSLGPDETRNAAIMDLASRGDWDAIKAASSWLPEANNIEWYAIKCSDGRLRVATVLSPVEVLNPLEPLSRDSASHGSR